MPSSSVADDREIQTAAFKVPWKLKENVGNPSSESFQRDNSLSKSAISHHFDRGDSIASLAIKYRVWFMDIKQLNIMCHHGPWQMLLGCITNTSEQSRRSHYLYLLLGAAFTSNTEVMVLYLEGVSDGKHSAFYSDSKPQIKARKRLGICEMLRYYL